MHTLRRARTIELRASAWDRSLGATYEETARARPIHFNRLCAPDIIVLLLLLFTYTRIYTQFPTFVLLGQITPACRLFIYQTILYTFVRTEWYNTPEVPRNYAARGSCLSDDIVRTNLSGWFVSINVRDWRITYSLSTCYAALRRKPFDRTNTIPRRIHCFTTDPLQKKKKNTIRKIKVKPRTHSRHRSSDRISCNKYLWFVYSQIFSIKTRFWCWEWNIKTETCTQ